MTGPNPDAELDQILGVDQLPPAVVTNAHCAAAETALRPLGPHLRMSHDAIEQTTRVARAIADAEQLGAIRTLTEHAIAGGPQVAAELAGVPGAEAPGVELANIRRLVARHGITPTDGNGVIRSTVAMVEEALIARPPVGPNHGGDR